ncbi:MAG: hypothetical protein FWB73_02310 [Treponema sp.]|nr:hypothetical protein [Treponema sp.]
MLKIPPIVNIILLLVIGVLVTLVIIGTVYAFARAPNAKPLLTLGNSGAKQPLSESDDVRVFSGLGRLRIPLSNSSTLILSIAFPYSANDTAFTEELAAKIGDFRSIAEGYFSDLPESYLYPIDDETAKQEILKRYNGILRLGKITALYFSDMILLD